MSKFEQYRQRPMEVSRAAWFEAAHYLHKCAEGQGYTQLHGHSFKVVVTLRGVAHGDNGWVEDLAAIGDALNGIRDALDHQCLNEIEGLETPSLENLCAWIAARLGEQFATLYAVEVSRPSLSEGCRLQVRD